MTPRPPSAARPGTKDVRGTRSIRPWLGIAAVVLVMIAAYGGWYLFFRPAGPAPVDLSALPPATLASGAAGGAGGSLDGTWKVDTSIGSGNTGSFVGYRVQEQLASVGAATAVGRTAGVSGSFTLTGTQVTAASITADLTGLTSDDPRRDGQLVNRGLETATFPTAQFVLTAPFDLGSLPASGQIARISAPGNLTLHGQTKAVTVSLEARVTGGTLEVTGSLPIAFADYQISPPTSMIALSVADNGIMELQLMFTRG